MFTGIVQGTAPFSIIAQKADMLSYTLKLPLSMLDNLTLGSSISVSGICQTVNRFEKKSGLVYFDAIAETLKLTNLKFFKSGDLLNFERSLKFSDEIGGHLLSGHIMTTVTIHEITPTPTHSTMTFECEASLLQYIIHKGYVALDGCSLTVVEPRLNFKNNTKALFDICFIPETLRLTTFGVKKIGDYVNLEIDSQTQTIVHTIQAYLKNNVK